MWTGAISHTASCTTRRWMSERSPQSGKRRRFSSRRNSRNRLTGLFRFAYRRVSVSDVVIPVLLVPQLVQPVRIGILAGNIAQDRRDNPADPHKGMYNTADFGLAGSSLDRNAASAVCCCATPPIINSPRRLVLARQTQFGVIVPFSAPAGVSAQESVPLPERFFSEAARIPCARFLTMRPVRAIPARPWCRAVRYRSLPDSRWAAMLCSSTMWSCVFLSSARTSKE